MVRAALAAVAQQVRAVGSAMAADCAPLHRLLADGGMAQNSHLMQMQADLLGVPVVIVCSDGLYRDILASYKYFNFDHGSNLSVFTMFLSLSLVCY